jgi:hypothetical protein
MVMSPVRLNQESLFWLRPQKWCSHAVCQISNIISQSLTFCFDILLKRIIYISKYINLFTLHILLKQLSLFSLKGEVTFVITHQFFNKSAIYSFTSKFNEDFKETLYSSQNVRRPLKLRFSSG